MEIFYPSHAHRYAMHYILTSIYRLSAASMLLLMMIAKIRILAVILNY